jgi:hypothetical protein
VGRQGKPAPFLTFIPSGNNGSDKHIPSGNISRNCPSRRFTTIGDKLPICGLSALTTAVVASLVICFIAPGGRRSVLAAIAKWHLTTNSDDAVVTNSFQNRIVRETIAPQHTVKPSNRCVDQFQSYTRRPGLARFRVYIPQGPGLRRGEPATFRAMRR